MRIVERDAVSLLLGFHALVVCGGGGGVHVFDRGDRFVGVEAVVDKDATAALIADEFDAGSFPVGSMGPKLAACRDFVLRAGRPCAIGALNDAEALLAGTAGTRIVARKNLPRGDQVRATARAVLIAACNESMSYAP